jgi:DNA-damage-inducible protein J
LTINDDFFYSEANQERLRKSIASLEAGKGTIHELIEADDE